MVPDEAARPRSAAGAGRRDGRRAVVFQPETGRRPTSTHPRRPGSSSRSPAIGLRRGLGPSCHALSLRWSRRQEAGRGTAPGRDLYAGSSISGLSRRRSPRSAQRNLLASTARGPTSTGRDRGPFRCDLQARPAPPSMPAQGLAGADDHDGDIIITPESTALRRPFADARAAGAALAKPDPIAPKDQDQVTWPQGGRGRGTRVRRRSSVSSARRARGRAWSASAAPSVACAARSRDGAGRCGEGLPSRRPVRGRQGRRGVSGHGGRSSGAPPGSGVTRDLWPCWDDASRGLRPNLAGAERTRESRPTPRTPRGPPPTQPKNPPPSEGHQTPRKKGLPPPHNPPTKPTEHSAPRKSQQTHHKRQKVKKKKIKKIKKKTAKKKIKKSALYLIC